MSINTTTSSQADIDTYLALDPMYSACAKHYGYNMLGPAGFITHPDLHARATITDHAWLSTPLFKVSANFDTSSSRTKKQAVLLTTGAFSPLHTGHIEMMDCAKVALEASDIEVVGGFISPSHDAYVTRKAKGDAQMHAEIRVALCEAAVASSSWLAIDTWEARYVPDECNFTDVFRHLKGILDHNFGKDAIEVWYVFGSDNIMFATVFKESGNAVVVHRGGTENPSNTLKALNMDSTRVIVSDITTTASSTEIRRGDFTLLPSPIRDTYPRFVDPAPFPSGVIILRDDLTYATKHWATSSVFDKALQTFSTNVQTALITAYDSNFSIVLAQVADQLTAASFALFDTKTISLDVYFKGTAHFEISRSFGCSDGQVRTSGIIARPGSASIAEQISQIAPGDYCIVDDDIASGTTIKQCIEMLPVHVKHTGQYAMVEHIGLLRSKIIDVCDLRDFLLGTLHGGLAVILPSGFHGRAPYMLPYVSLVSRASIPPTKHLQCALDLWIANEEFFRTIPVTLKLIDTPQYTRDLLTSAGFTQDITLADICAYHIKILSHSVSAQTKFAPRQ
jgi:nicotinic acid mononucleotide adenylyltransferase